MTPPPAAGLAGPPKVTDVPAETGAEEPKTIAAPRWLLTPSARRAARAAACRETTAGEWGWPPGPAPYAIVPADAPSNTARIATWAATRRCRTTDFSNA